MGQYYKIFNLDARQKLKPSSFDDGLKLMEFGSSAGATLSALALLLAHGADHRGPWAGQRIVVAGDYADEGRFVPESHAQHNLYSYDSAANEEGSDGEGTPYRYEECSDQVRRMAAALEPTPYEFRGGGLTAGAAKLMSDDGVFESFEELLEAFDVAPRERLDALMTEIQYFFRVAGLATPLGWSYSLSSIRIEGSPDGHRVSRLIATFDHKDGRAVPPYTLTLKFPATAAQVREAFDITKEAHLAA